MQNQSRPTAKQPSAFTLIELLVVIGIIALLIGILVPMAQRVRITAQRTATLSDINNLTQACEAYFTDFGAYPGLINDNDLASMPVVPPATSRTIKFVNYPTNVDGTTYAAPGTVANVVVTSSENLLLSLMGGLSVRTATGDTLAANAETVTFDLSTVGNGAASMNQVKPSRSQAYLTGIRPQQLSTGYINRTSGSYLPGKWMANNPNGTSYTPTDTFLPEMLDSFSTPSPILYMRAYRGNTGFINTPTVTATGVQYDLGQIGMYGFPLADTVTNDTKRARTFGYYYPQVLDSSSGVIFTAGPQAYFGNAQLTTKSSDTKLPLHKDTYLLISAGEDGFYGTADDIHN